MSEEARPNRVRRGVHYVRRSQHLLFLLAGGVNTAVGFCSYTFCVMVLDVHYRWAALVALLAGMMAGFLQSRHGIFRTGSRASLAKYVALWTILYLMSIGLIGFLVGQGLGEVVAYIIAAPFTVPVSFLVQKYWVFR